MGPAKKILIADDDSDIIEATSTLLNLVGYEVISTLYGDSVPQLAEVIPHLIILDVWMGGIDGRDICKKLKATYSTKDIPVLMFSASRDIRLSVLEAGADDFIEKPFELDQLLHKIDDLILKAG